MRDAWRRYLSGSNIVIAFIGSKEPGLLDQWNRPTNRASNVVRVEVRVRILRLKCRWCKLSLVYLVIERPGGQRGVLVVVESRSVIVRATAFGSDSNIGDARIFRA